MKLNLSPTMVGHIRGKKYPKSVAHLSVHQRIVLSMMLRRKPARFSVAETAAFYWQTIHGLAVRELIAFQFVKDEIYVVPTDEGRIASHSSPPVEVVMRDI